jgi:hypothetical protein
VLCGILSEKFNDDSMLGKLTSSSLLCVLSPVSVIGDKQELVKIYKQTNAIAPRCFAPQCENTPRQQKKQMETRVSVQLRPTGPEIGKRPDHAP